MGRIDRTLMRRDMSRFTAIAYDFPVEFADPTGL